MLKFQSGSFLERITYEMIDYCLLIQDIAFSMPMLGRLLAMVWVVLRY